VDVSDAGTAAFGRDRDSAGEVGAIVMRSPYAPGSDIKTQSRRAVIGVRLMRVGTRVSDGFGGHRCPGRTKQQSSSQKRSGEGVPWP
jgi:hypothetical protein